jgi:HAD superfamily phosphoserine phosphatase-like hydrolase
MGLLSMQNLHHFVFKALFLGKSSHLINSFVSKYLDQHFETSLYVPAWERFVKAKKRGDYVIILSSSPHFLVEAIARRLGVDAWDATHYQVDKDEKFCRISRQMQGEDKAKYLHKLSKEFKIPTTEITAYTDSHLDLPFLKAAGKAIGVNPDRVLRKICQRNQWEII